MRGCVLLSECVRRWGGDGVEGGFQAFIRTFPVFTEALPAGAIAGIVVVAVVAVVAAATLASWGCHRRLNGLHKQAVLPARPLKPEAAGANVALSDCAAVVSVPVTVVVSRNAGEEFSEGI